MSPGRGYHVAIRCIGIWSSWSFVSDVAPMPPSCFNSAHCPDGSTSSAPGQHHTIYLSNVGRDKGGVEPMPMYERGTRLYRLDPGVISRNSSCSRTALSFEPFHDLNAASSVALRQKPAYMQLTGSTLMLTIPAPASIHAATCARHDTNDRCV